LDSAATYTASINWGDGTTSAGAIGTITGPGGSVQTQVSGTHTYAEENVYQITTTVTESGGQSATTKSTATVRDAPLTLTGTAFQPTEGVNYTGQVATLTDSVTDAGATYQATISWGDGQTNVVTVTGGTVTGSHTYVIAGTYNVTVTASDDGKSSTTAQTTAT